jgi:hypothetical protein
LTSFQNTGILNRISKEIFMRLLPSFLMVSFLVATSFGTVINQIGSYSNWPTSWTSLGGYDADNSLTETLDFVGNATAPGLYYARSSSYIFFRMRVEEPSRPPRQTAHTSS